MNLSELASDLFLYLVTFRRQVRKGLTPEIHQVRSQLLDIFETMDHRAREEARLEKLYQKAKYPLVATADEILINANWAYSSQWEDEILEYEYFKTRIAGEKFFTMIEDLGDQDEESAEIFYHCLALGFVGRYKDDSEELRRLKRRLYRMLPGRVSDEEKRVTPDAYFIAEGVKDNYRPLVNLGRILVICVTLLAVLWIGYFIYVKKIVPGNIIRYSREMKAAVAPAGGAAEGEAKSEADAAPPEKPPVEAKAKSKETKETEKAKEAAKSKAPVKEKAPAKSESAKTEKSGSEKEKSKAE